MLQEPAPGPAPVRPLEVAILVTPEIGTASAFAVLHILGAVGTFWQTLHGQPGTPCFNPRLVSADGKSFADTHGITITPHGAMTDTPQPDVIIIPEAVFEPWGGYPESWNPITEWIRRSYANGAIVASICSGTLLLAETGLLDGENATAHWAYADGVAQRHPKIRMRPDRVLVLAGADDRLITTGGFSSWHDLLLYLVARLVSQAESRRMAKLFLLDWHIDGQKPFAALTVGRKHDDPLVSAAQLWAADNYANPNPVQTMAAQSGLTERSFLRRFKKATGQAPLEYIQTLRIEEAKQMLETTDMSSDAIAEEVGYTEPSAFRHLFRKLVGITPSSYRARMQREAMVA